MKHFTTFCPSWRFILLSQSDEFKLAKSSSTILSSTSDLHFKVNVAIYCDAKVFKSTRFIFKMLEYLSLLDVMSANFASLMWRLCCKLLRCILLSSSWKSSTVSSKKPSIKKIVKIIQEIFIVFLILDNCYYYY